MVPKLKTFIEEYIDLIEKKRWQALYSYATAEIPFQIGNLSYNLIEAGVNPLEDLNRILPQMFADSMIDELVIPENITRIQREAFKCCYSLTKISLPSSIVHIDDTAFVGCYELEDICYQGTTTEFIRHINPTTRMFRDIKTARINCSDANIFIDFDGTVSIEED